MDDHMTYEEPGAILAARREELGLTQAEVAARLDYENVSFISMMERGTSKVPLERVFDVARALELDETWFLERMLRDRAETLPLAEHLFGPGGPLHGASPAMVPPPERVEHGPEAAAPEGIGDAGDEGEPESGPERVGGGEPAAAPPEGGRPGGEEAVARAPSAGAVRPPAPRPTPWTIEYEGVLRIFPPPTAARLEAP